MRIVITGGGSGLGYALMERHLALGDKVTVIDILPKPEVFNTDLFKAKLEWLQCDVGDLNVFETLLKKLEGENIRSCRVYLVAGIGYFGDLSKQSYESIDKIISVNLSTRIKQTQQMIWISERQNLSFQIFLISSSTAYIPVPRFATYSATTGGLVNFSRAVQSEIAKSAIKIVVAIPDGMATNFQKTAGVEKISKDLLSPLTVASKLVTVSSDFSGVILIGKKIYFMNLVTRAMPRKLVDFLILKISKRRFD